MCQERATCPIYDKEGERGCNKCKFFRGYCAINKVGSLLLAISIVFYIIITYKVW